MAESIKEAKAICSWATLDAQTTCSQLTLDAKTNCSWVILYNQDCLLGGSQGSQDNPRLYHMRGWSYLLLSHQRYWGPEGLPGWDTPKRMAISCRIWRCKSSDRRVEAKLTSSQPARPLHAPVHQSSRAPWLLPTTLYWDRHLHHLQLSYGGGLLQWKNSPFQTLLLHQCPSSLLGQKTAPFPQSCGEHAFGWNHFKGNFWRTPQL